MGATFREAMDALGLTAPEVAALLERPIQSVKQMRLDPDAEGFRPPPKGWEGILARYAREKGEGLREYADELERAGNAKA